MNIPIYQGSSSFAPGKTPFGFYDFDPDFVKDADRVVSFCARRLGYPIVDIELQDVNFYAAFEEAVTAYGNELYSYQIRDNYLNIHGNPINPSSSLNNNVTYPNLNYIIKTAANYGAEAGVGGSIPLYSGSIDLTEGKQTYDLKEWAVSRSIEPGELEIRRVFYTAPPAVTKFFDPFVGTGMGFQGMMDSFGWGNMSPAISYLMMPLNYDIQVMQAIELNDTIRKSNYSFELVNNVLKIFPIPNTKGLMWFEYIKSSERGNASTLTIQTDPITGEITDTRYPNGVISNVSNAPYTNPKYSQINSVGRQWIFEFSLAVCKEILGFIRGKYSNIPIPKDNINLNYGDLISQGQKEKDDLITKLRTWFDDTSRRALLERKAAETTALNQELNNVPFQMIYVG